MGLNSSDIAHINGGIDQSRTERENGFVILITSPTSVPSSYQYLGDEYSFDIEFFSNYSPENSPQITFNGEININKQNTDDYTRADLTSGDYTAKIDYNNTEYFGSSSEAFQKIDASQQAAINNTYGMYYRIASEKINNLTTTFTYDMNGNLTKKLEKIPGSTYPQEFSYNSQNELLETIFEDGATETYSNELLVTLPSTLDQYYILTDCFGHIRKYTNTDASNKKVEIFSDGKGRKIAEHIPVLNSAVDKDKWTIYKYDDLDRLKMVINRTEGIDNNGNPITQNQIIRYWYNKEGRIKYIYHPDFGVNSYGYDDVGNVRFVQTQAQADSLEVSFYEYDDLNRLTLTGMAKVELQHDNFGDETLPEPIINSTFRVT